jgi:hypothetical protein
MMCAYTYTEYRMIRMILRKYYTAELFYYHQYDMIYTVYSTLLSFYFYFYIIIFIKML